MGDLKTIGAVLVATACGAIGFAATAVLAPTSFNYADASEERQQQLLDGIAKGFESGFKATAGDNAVIKRITASAATDVISVDVQFTKKEVENAPPKAIEAFRDQVYTQQCRYLDHKQILDSGVSLKMRTMRPSGSTLTTFNISKAGCAPFLDAA